MSNYSKTKRFYITGGPRGFGYQIIDKGVDLKSHKRLFHTSDVEQAKLVFETIEENHTDFPEPKTDWTPKVLIIKGKHCTDHYLIKSIEDLNEVAFDYMHIHWDTKPEYNPFQKWEYSKYNESVSQECIDLCTNDRLKKEMIRTNENSKSNIKSTDEHNGLIDKVNYLMENNKKVGAFSLLELCDFLYDTIELETFSNHRTH